MTARAFGMRSTGREREEGPDIVPDPLSASLVDSLRRATGDPSACSFQLMGEDLAAMSGRHLVAAARAYEQQLHARVPPALYEAFTAEQDRYLATAHGWLTRHNRSVTDRIDGYLALGRACRFQYPWPVVAVVGLCAVIDGLERLYRFGAVGAALSRLGVATRHDRRIDRALDVLRRTNRGIFADSVPTVLLGLHCDALRRDGHAGLAAALLDGPLPPILDDNSRALAHGLYCGLDIADPAARFRHLGVLTRRHFAREQAIFSHHLGSHHLGSHHLGSHHLGAHHLGAHPRQHEPAPRASRRKPPWARRLLRLVEPQPAVPVPRIHGGRLVLAPYPLPPGFRITDHDARVALFGRLYVDPVVASPASYRAAVDYVWRRFGRGPAPYIPA